MASIKKSRFSKRCLVLCCIAGSVVACVGMRLVQLQIVNPIQSGGVIKSGLIQTEVLPAKRGLIMDAKEEVLTNNVQSAELIGDRYHLQDPKVVAWGLAFSKAQHSPGWDELSDTDKELRIKKYRARLLAQAASKEEGKQEYNLAQLLLSESNDTAPAKNGKDMAHENLEKLYDPEIAKSYIREHEEYAAKIIAPYVDDMSYEEILQKIRQDGVERPQQRILLAKNLPEEKGEELNRVLKEARVQGFKCETIHKRKYAAPDCLTHVLGYVGQQTEGSALLTGVSGLEATLDRFLRGQDGIRENRKDSRGRIIPSEDDRFKAPVHGLNVKLTVDMELQTIVEEELDKGLAHYHAPRGTIIVVEPKTGSILALASRPQFNLNTKENMQEGALNFAVQGLYEPGSTFKVVSVTSAVDSGKLTFNSPIDCRTRIVPGGKPVSDAPRSYGTLPVKGVLWKSSNPGAYGIGLAATPPVYKKYLEAFGFRTKTGIELPSETRGQCQDITNKVNFSRVTYGYSITVTPLQVAMAYAAIANDGVRMKPRIVDEIFTSNGALFEKREPVEVERVMKQKTARELREALAGVTAPGGTATRAAIEGYRIGGKTGTAHKVKEKGGGYYDNRYTVSFAGIFPADDPAFVCLVVIDDPHPTDCKAGGGTVCAPIFKNVATRLASALNIPKDGGMSSAAKTGVAMNPPATQNKKATRR